MLDINYIKDAVKRLAYEDMTYQQFGSWGHAHLFKPVIDEAKLVAWEDDMQIKLPQDFRLYLTQLGNGGAGPAYGIAPFDLKNAPELKLPCPYSDDQEKLFNDLAQEWFEMDNLEEEDLYERYYQNHPEEQRLPFAEWSKQYDDGTYEDLEKKMLHHGQVWIANQGCSLDIYLILNGSETGRCHCTNIDYDYSYPVTKKQWQAYNQLPDPKPHRPITWPEYKESLSDFSNYIMDYVESGLKIINNFSRSLRDQFKQEREAALEFEQAMLSNDLPEVERLIGKLANASLSFKTRSFYWIYAERLTQAYPNNPVFTKFETQIKYQTNSTCCYNCVTFAEKSRNNIDYPHPSFEEFKATFSQPD